MEKEFPNWSHVPQRQAKNWAIITHGQSGGSEESGESCMRLVLVTAVWKIIRDELHISKVSAHWVPRLLSPL